MFILIAWFAEDSSAGWGALTLGCGELPAVVMQTPNLEAKPTAVCGASAVWAELGR